VVDPKRLPPDHPLRELPGVGVAYELALALYQRAGRPEDAERHLDLVALGIVADVATQTGDVRYLLQRGLEALRRTGRLGLRALMEQAGIRPETVDEEEIGFGLAPRLNALGRLDDANVAVELLTTEDLARARVLASMLEGLNARRKLLCDQVTQAALARIEEEPALLDHGALVLADPAWPGGVLGIVAGRLADRYGRPAILLKAPPDEVARGSARSVEGCNITAAIAAHQDMLVKFGGHPMAAGLSIEPEKIPAFRRALGRTVEEMMARADVAPTVEIDGYLPLADLSLELVAELERLAPFGPGNPPFVLVTRGLSIASRRTIGRRQSHRLVVVEDEAGVEQKVVWWRGADREMPEGTFDLAYHLGVNEYRGQREVQVVWVDARPVGPPVEEVRPPVPALQVVDYRWEPNPRRLLDRVRTRGQRHEPAGAMHASPLPGQVAVWAEAGDRAAVDGQDRRELAPAAELVIWTAPPGPEELRAALAAVGPERVVVFARDPGMDEAAAFLGRLAGLVKRALRVDEGRVELETLAAATAQREATVRRGVAWLAAKGQVAVVENMGAEMIMTPGVTADPAAVDRATRELQALLAETAAYRTHFARAEDVEQLIKPYVPERGR
jgi:single-stranded-DNA-specific exonuclease